MRTIGYIAAMLGCVACAIAIGVFAGYFVGAVMIVAPLYLGARLIGSAFRRTRGSTSQSTS